MSESIEYLFFNQSICSRFTQFLSDKSISWIEGIEPVNDAILIQVIESEIEQCWDELDNFYDNLSFEDQKLLEEDEQHEDDVSTAGVHFNLKNGQQAIASVNPQVLNRMLKVVSFDEFSDFVDAIAKSAEEQDSRSICQR